MININYRRGIRQAGDYRDTLSLSIDHRTCEIPRDDLFSDDFGFKINTLATNLAHIFILRRPLIRLFKNIVYLEGILHFRRWKLGWTIQQLVFRKISKNKICHFWQAPLVATGPLWNIFFITEWIAWKLKILTDIKIRFMKNQTFSQSGQ
jgi:hypothetical protein